MKSDMTQACSLDIRAVVLIPVMPEILYAKESML